MEQKSISAHTWPLMMADKEVACAALFIDIRDSTLISDDQTKSARTIASLTQIFISEVRTRYEVQELALPVPMVRSLGDGLFCVWDFGEHPTEYPKKKQLLLQAILKIYSGLGQSIQQQWERETEITVGMGLSAGDVMRASYSLSDLPIVLRDYYGYVINLAAKLQSAARPHGLIVAGNYCDQKDWETHSKELTQVTLTIPPLKGETICYASEQICKEAKFQRRNWTCLAWPGFAKSNPSSAPGMISTSSGGEFGLTQAGVTVITHEGINGKISTLQVWPRSQKAMERGDSFEMIIDDYDGLWAMVDQRTIDLIQPNDVDMAQQLPKILEISHGLLAAIDKGYEHVGGTNRSPFYYLPVRCGLNAYAWNNEKCDLGAIDTYDDILVDGHARNGLALYDNPGASLPVLLSCLRAKLRRRGKSFYLDDVFNATQEHFTELVKYLTKLQKKLEGRQLFQLYDTIKALSRSLAFGNVKVVLGGGAWLIDDANVTISGSRPVVRSRRPKLDEAFLWVEGASLLQAALRNGQRPEDYVDFLKRHLLGEGYQVLLPSADPYGATPAHAKIIERIIQAVQKDAEVAAQTGTEPTINSTFLETAEIFKNPRELGEKIRIRRKPTHLQDWVDCWARIRKQFCALSGSG